MQHKHEEEHHPAQLNDSQVPPDSLPQKQRDESRPLEHTGDDPQQESLGERVEEEAEEVVREAQHEVAASRRPWYQSIRLGHILLGVYAILLALFGLLAWWVHYHPILPIDVAITREFQENQAPWLRDTMIAVSYPGNILFLSLGLILLAAALFWLVRLRLEAVTVLIVSGVSALLNTLIKVLVARPRPNASLVEVIQNASGQSFPSGHVMSYIALWGLLFSFGIILFKGNRWWRIALLIIPALFIALVGPSRIYLGDHWASDVLGAYLIGGAWLGIALWIYLKLDEKGVLASRRKSDV